MSSLSRSVVLGWAAAASSCAAPRQGAAPAAPATSSAEGIAPDVRVRIVEARFGAEHSVRSEPLEVPFGVGQNGTELVYVLLERATRAGAAYVGDLALTATFRWRGDLVECRAPVRFAGDPLLRSSPADATPLPAGPYGTEIDVYQPQPLDVTATERELVCRPRTETVRRKRRVTTSGRGAENSRLADGESSRVETTAAVETRDVCFFEPITRRTTRYDYEIKLRFVPPDWEALGRRYADGTLVAGRPRCYRLAEEDLRRAPPYRLTATAYHTGAVKVALPERLPSRGSVEAQWSPGLMTTRDVCNQIMHAAAQKNFFGGPREYDQCLGDEQMRNLERRRRGIVDDSETVEPDTEP